MSLGHAFVLINLFFAIVIGLYFWNLLRQQQSNKSAVDRESRKEMEKLHRMQRVALTEPLAEKTRPASFDEIVGQNDGLKALRAAPLRPQSATCDHLRAARCGKDGGCSPRSRRGEAQSAVSLYGKRSVCRGGRHDGPV